MHMWKSVLNEKIGYTPDPVLITPDFHISSSKLMPIGRFGTKSKTSRTTRDETIRS